VRPGGFKTKLGKKTRRGEKIKSGKLASAGGSDRLRGGGKRMEGGAQETQELTSGNIWPHVPLQPRLFPTTQLVKAEKRNVLEERN